jgi:putative two-component system response regulator
MKRILIVDDNIATLKQIGALLTGEYEVVLAKSGALALKILQTESPSLILLDVEMPELNGFETIAMIKKNPAWNALPVIFLTGNNDSETETKALESGAMDFVTKPVTKDILKHRIELHLKYAEYRSSLENTVRSLEDSIISSFSRLIDCKDQNTGAHVIRTAQSARLIGDELLTRGVFSEITEEFIDTLARAAPFHDIGKVGISDMLLMKPAALTDDEYSEVKKHTTIGAALIRAIRKRTRALEYLSFAEVIAECHHERYDGKGYPKGIAGDDIPLCARIVAVANDYDACTTERVYRKALSHKDACNHVFDGAGGKFDPRIVEAFSAVSGKCAEVSADGMMLFNLARMKMTHEKNSNC